MKESQRALPLPGCPTQQGVSCLHALGTYYPLMNNYENMYILINRVTSTDHGPPSVVSDLN